MQELNSKAFADNPKFDNDFYAEWSFSEYAKSYYTNLLNNPEAVCFIVEDDGKMVGYAAVGPKTVNHRLSRYCEIENIGIIPKYRKRGIGKKTNKRMLWLGKAEGISENISQFLL